ncbi:MAG TPA: acyl-CoA dehydrogenase family protein [Dehalococcoidia bacterium]|nr:acyl-CoA dehydrogenase family protein [Dehalococcoidia bacterium]
MTWDVSGLCATGSHDVVASDVFVPHGYGYQLGTARPVHEGPLYGYSVLGLLSVAVAGVALGIGRGAPDDFRLLAGAKTPTGRRKALAEWSIAQARYAEAEGALRSGRAFLIEAVEGVWQTLVRGERPSDAQRAMVRLAASTAVVGATKAVDAAYDLAGGSAIYSDHTLQRRFRDIHTLTAHVMIGQSSFEAAGRALLGLPLSPGFL